MLCQIGRAVSSALSRSLEFELVIKNLNMTEAVLFQSDCCYSLKMWTKRHCHTSAIFRDSIRVAPLAIGCLEALLPLLSRPSQASTFSA